MGSIFCWMHDVKLIFLFASAHNSACSQDEDGTLNDEGNAEDYLEQPSDSTLQPNLESVRTTSCDLQEQLPIPQRAGWLPSPTVDHRHQPWLPDIPGMHFLLRPPEHSNLYSGRLPYISTQALLADGRQVHRSPFSPPLLLAVVSAFALTCKLVHMIPGLHVGTIPWT